MIARELFEKLAADVGAECVASHAPRELCGAAPELTLAPRDGESLARATGALGRLGLAALVRGGGSRDSGGNASGPVDVILSTAGLAGIDTFEPAEGVCHAGAGTPLASLRAAVSAEGWELPLDSAEPGATVGGALSTAAFGPSSHAFGPAREQVLGLEVALASGELTRCGGRVVKNVTGYDLAKLYTGAWGSLGVIAGAWLRLRPAPERTAVLRASGSDAAGACAPGLAAARRATCRACALVAREGSVSLVLELAADGASVERDLAWARDSLGAEEVGGSALSELRALQGGAPGGEGLRFRVAALPAVLPGALSALAEAGAELLAYPGAGLAYAGFAAPAPPSAGRADRLFAAVERIAVDAGGSFACESAPLWARRGRDVFGASGPTLALCRALKQRFDPGRVLNPGRFAGNL